MTSRLIISILGIIFTIPGEYGFPSFYNLLSDVFGFSFKDNIGGWIFFLVMIFPFFLSVAYITLRSKARGFTKLLAVVGGVFWWYLIIILTLTTFRFAYTSLLIWIGILVFEVLSIKKLRNFKYAIFHDV